MILRGLRACTDLSQRELVKTDTTKPKCFRRFHWERKLLEAVRDPDHASQAQDNESGQRVSNRRRSALVAGRITPV